MAEPQIISATGVAWGYGVCRDHVFQQFATNPMGGRTSWILHTVCELAVLVVLVVSALPLPTACNWSVCEQVAGVPRARLYPPPLPPTGAPSIACARWRGSTFLRTLVLRFDVVHFYIWGAVDPLAV